jgi:acetolactate synthase-1/2/3 large subunit
MAKLLTQTREFLAQKAAIDLPTGGMAAELIRGDTVSTVLIEALQALGLRHAFGMIGGAVVPFYDALCRSEVGLVHCRHENGAVFAAIEASLADDAPALAFTTTGPGLTNALTGAVTARFEGAKLLLVSAITPTCKRGRYPIQESSSETMGGGSLYSPGGLFDYAVAMHDPQELPRIIRTLTQGFASPRGFVAHLALPLPVQASPAPRVALTVPRVEVAPSHKTMDAVIEALRERFAIWVGYGARRAAGLIAELVRRTNAPVFSTPRGKGVFPEHDPRFLGVSGLGGHDDLAARLAAARVERVLVLGSRLGELSSSYDSGLIPRRGLVHVDLDPKVPGAGYPEAETLAVQAEIAEFLTALLERCDELGGPRAIVGDPRPAPAWLEPRAEERVRPRYLMQCLQARVVEGSDAVILSETGNSLAWTNRHLRFPVADRYRMSGMFCPMGHVSAGILGTVATGRRALAVVGDGAFLMQNELSTAAAIRANAIWVVLNDARYGMCDQGLRCLGYPPADLQFPEVDFLALARSMGGDGVRVWRESQVNDALEWALRSRGPFVVDVIIDPNELAPVADRIASIYTQTSGTPEK